MTNKTKAVIKLTDTQLVMLSSAAQREGGLILVPESIKGAARVLGSLEKRGLIHGVEVECQQPNYGTNKAGRRTGFAITEDGLRAIGLEPVAAAEPERPATTSNKRRGRCAPNGAVDDSGSVVAAGRVPREGTKQALILGLLSRETGASLEDLVSATGWLPHTARAALTRLRQSGCALDKSKGPTGVTLYRIPLHGGDSSREAA